MCCIARKDKFVIGGKRLVFYNNAVVADTRGGGNVFDEIYPIDANFNEYHNFLVVQTKIDIRIYNAMTGKL